MTRSCCVTRVFNLNFANMSLLVVSLEFAAQIMKNLQEVVKNMDADAWMYAPNNGSDEITLESLQVRLCFYYLRYENM